MSKAPPPSNPFIVKPRQGRRKKSNKKGAVIGTAQKKPGRLQLYLKTNSLKPVNRVLPQARRNRFTKNQNRSFASANPTVYSGTIPTRRALPQNSTPFVRTSILPFDTRPVRFPSNSILPTAVVNPYNILNLDFDTNAFSATDATKSLFGKNGQMMAFLFKNPLRSMILYNPNSAKHSNIYDLQFNEADIQTAPQKYLYLDQGYPAMLDIAWLKCSTVDSVPSSDGFHGPYLYCGTTYSPLKKNFWIDTQIDTPSEVVLHFEYLNGSNVWTPLPVANIVGDEIIAVERVSGFQVVQNQIIAEYETNDLSDSSFSMNSSGVATIQFFQRGYYSFSFCGNYLTGVTSSNIRVSGTYEIPAIDVLAHLAVPGLDTNRHKIRSHRTTSAALMLTCKAPMVQVAGEIKAIQRSHTTPWFTTLDPDTMANTQNIYGNRCSVKPWANGIYGFVKPTTIEEYDFNDDFSFRSNELADMSYDLFGTGYLQYFVDVGASNSGIGYLTVAHVIEYATVDMWTSRARTPFNHNLLEPLIHSLSTIEQFHENPFHIADLISALGGGIKWGAQLLLKNANPLFKIISGVAALSSL